MVQGYLPRRIVPPLRLDALLIRHQVNDVMMAPRA